MISGKDGTVSIDGGTLAEITKFNIAITNAVQTQAHSGSSGWKEAVGGIKEWSGGIEVKSESGGVQPELWDSLNDGDSVALILQTATGKTYSGNAIVGNMALECDISEGSIPHWTCDVIGNGALTVTED